MAPITANPPNLVLSGKSPGSTVISWDLTPDTGYVSRQVTGTAPQADAPFDPPALPVPPDPSHFPSKGTKTDTDIELGNTYIYTLHNVVTGAVYTATVTTTAATGSQQGLIDSIIARAAVDRAVTPPQRIYNLTVAPGVDKVRISFNTTQATTPVVTLTAPDGTQVAGWFPLFGGPTTSHDCMLGETTPLDQNTPFHFTIVAFGKDPIGRDIKVTIGDGFTTGRRDVHVMFDTIEMRDDGDTFGSGEFRFAFTAGDADEPTEFLVNSTWPVDTSDFVDNPIDISDHDPKVQVPEGTALTIPLAPRRLFVQVVGMDDDNVFGLSSLPGFIPPFREGTDGQSTDSFDMAWSGVVFDIEDLPSPHFEEPIQLPTGEFAVAFTVFGHLTVNTQIPIWVTTRFVPRATAPALTVLQKDFHPAVVGGGPGSVHMLAFGPDGALYQQDLQRKLPRHQGWQQVGGEVAAPITALAAADGTLDLFGFDRAGALLHRRLVGGRSGGQWQNLGEHFAAPVAAAAGANGSVEVFGLTKDGGILHCSLAGQEAKRSGWHRVGDDVAGSLTAVSFADGSVGVFAIGRDGSVLHKRHAGQAWHPAGSHWQAIGTAPGSRMIAQSTDRKGIVLVTLSEKDDIGVLVWPDYPAGDPRQRWKSHGTVESWLAGRRATGEPQKQTLGQS